MPSPATSGSVACPPLAIARAVTRASTANSARAARRGRSNAGSAVTGEPAAIGPRPVSDTQARTAKTAALNAVNTRNPRVAAVESLASTTTENVPTARPDSTVQLMSARFEAICSAATPGV